MYHFSPLAQQQSDLLVLLSSTTGTTPLQSLATGVTNTASGVDDGGGLTNTSNRSTTPARIYSEGVDDDDDGGGRDNMFDFQQQQTYNDDSDVDNAFVLSSTTAGQSPIASVHDKRVYNPQRQDELVLSTTSTSVFNQQQVPESVTAPTQQQQPQQAFYPKPHSIDNPYYYWPTSCYSPGAATVAMESTGMACLDSDYSSNNEDILTLQLLQQQQQQQYHQHQCSNNQQQQQQQQQPQPQQPTPMYQTDDGSHSSNSSVKTNNALDYEDLFRRHSFDTTATATAAIEQPLAVAQPLPADSVQQQQQQQQQQQHYHYHHQHRGSLPNLYIPGMTQSSSSSLSSWTDIGTSSSNNHGSQYHSSGSSNKKRSPSSPKQQRTKRRLVNGGGGVTSTTTKSANHAVAAAAAAAAAVARSKSVDFTAFGNNSKEWFATATPTVNHTNGDDSSNDSGDDNGHNHHHHHQQDASNTEQQQEEVFPEINDVDWDTARHNPSAVPRRQKLRYDGDEYTPKWVRYTGQLKEGYCDSCKPGKWLQLKNSAYWYHKQFFHGISSVSGKRFLEPLEQRAGDHDVVEGLCHQCQQFVPICNAKRKTSVLWYRHAHKCHIYDKPKSVAGSKRSSNMPSSTKRYLT